MKGVQMRKRLTKIEKEAKVACEQIKTEQWDACIVGRKTCPTCGGKGFVWCKNRYGHKWERFCRRCDGSGEITGVIHAPNSAIANAAGREE